MSEGLKTIKNSYVNRVCKPGSLLCCRYLVFSCEQWACAKNTSYEEYFDNRVRCGKMNAIGNNCEGK